MTQLAFEEFGAGTPLVFLHGIAMDRSVWQPVIDKIGDTYRCIRVDLVGHGTSPSTGAYDVFSQANALGELIADLGLDRPIIIGHSYGGFVATLLGASVPVRGVINVDQELDTASFKNGVAPFESRLRGEDFEGGFADYVATLGPDLVPTERQSMAVMVPDPEVVLGVWTMVLDSPASDLNAMIEPVLESYQVPYLAIYGSAISDEERRLVSAIPGAKFEEWSGFGHFIHLVDPSKLAQRIIDFAGQVS